MSILLSVAIAMLVGLLMTRAFKLFKLPAVTAYLIAGILIGPYFLGALHIEGIGFVSASAVNQMSIISKIALGFIAFSIGNEFRLSDLRKTGHQATVIGIFQAISATIIVDIALIVFSVFAPDKISISQAIVLGAIATATAPAATLMVVRQYKAKGPVTKLLLPIVALDDAVGLVVFAISFGIAKAIQFGEIDLVSIIVNPLLEIVLSLVLGCIMGLILTKLETLFNSNSNRLTMTIAIVLLTTALSLVEFHIGSFRIGFSSLLVCMMLGTIFCNICPLSEDLMSLTDTWTTPLFALFFVISGAELELGVFKDIMIVAIGIIYIITRCLGKYYGARLSAKFTNCSKTIQKYLGITLFPQAGVALGMCATAMELGEAGLLIRNITLFAVLIYELIGPLLTKNALIKAGDIKPPSLEIINRREIKLANLKNKEE